MSAFTTPRPSSPSRPSRPSREPSLPPHEIPQNVYRPKAPLRARTLRVSRLTPEGSPNDVRHVVLDLAALRAPGAPPLRYLEGQSVGVVPPGVDESGKPHKVRLYSVASSRRGDDGSGRTVSLCVKRVVLTPGGDGAPAKQGVASSHLCDLAVGDEVMVTGPVGKSFLLPDDPSTPMIFVATGTGIAPYRAFLRRMFLEANTPWRGDTWLFFGAQYACDLPYADELRQYSCRFVTACSREEKNASGGRMYVQHRMETHRDALRAIVDRGAHVYVCGIVGMERGVEEALGADALAQLKATKRWHVETY